MPSNVEALTQINLDDLVTSFGWQNRPWLSRLLRFIFRQPAKTFANHIIDYDHITGLDGIHKGGHALLQRYVKAIRIFGADRIPASAFLALSNHPGMTDTVALFSALNREDLHIIALDRPFLNILSNTARQLFYVHDDPTRRMTLVRQVSTHLRNGGAILTFPAGHIEPDPDIYEGAAESLQAWTDSVGVFIRMAPEAAILPILVRGVVSKRYSNHWLLKVKKTKEEREKLATALQLLGMIIFNEKPVTVTIQIGKPIYAKDLGTMDTAVIHHAVLSEMKHMIENPPKDQ